MIAFRICLIPAIQMATSIMLLMLIVVIFGAMVDGMMPVVLSVPKGRKDTLVLWDRLGHRVLLERRGNKVLLANKGHKDCRGR